MLRTALLGGCPPQDCPFRVAHAAVQYCQLQMQESEKSFVKRLEDVTSQLATVKGELDVEREEVRHH